MAIFSPSPSETLRSMKCVATLKSGGNVNRAAMISGRLLRCGSRSSILQILLKPIDGALHRINLVLALGEAVAFLRIVVRVNNSAAFLQQIYDLLGFFPGNPGIIVAL